jgi:hypothetical protein
MNSNMSKIQTHKVFVDLDNGKTAIILGRSSIMGDWNVTSEISFTSVVFKKDDAAIFLVNLRGKRVRIERSIDIKYGTITTQKFEETPMLTSVCYVLKLTIRLESESGIPQVQTNGEVAFRS